MSRLIANMTGHMLNIFIKRHSWLKGDCNDYTLAEILYCTSHRDVKVFGRDIPRPGFVSPGTERPIDRNDSFRALSQHQS